MHHLDEGFNSHRWLRVGGMCDFRSERSVLRIWGNSQSMEGLSLSKYEKSGSIRSTVLSFPAPSPQRLRKMVLGGIQGVWPPSLALTHTPQSFPCSHMLSSCHKYCTVKEKDLP